MKKSIKILLYTIILGILIPVNAYGRSYPVKEVSKPGCRFTKWSSHDNDCKQPLPIIKGGKYNDYKDNLQYRIVYSVLWSSTYKNGWDVGYGSHLGVDIASAEGTPVYAISNGKVYVAGVLNGRGKTVVIQHDFDGKSIYSVYAHLSDINVNKGDIVSEGSKIGEIGSTGNSTGNHLHFQIDINQKGTHPYYHNGCKGNVFDIVNGGLCNDMVVSNTIDPIYFLENNGAILLLNKTEQEIIDTVEKIKEDNKINPNDIENSEQILKKELEMFLARFKITIKSKIVANVLNVGEKGIIEISAINRGNKKPYTLNIPDAISINFLNNNAESFPKSIRYIDGKRNIEIKGIKEGLTTVYFQIGKNTLGSQKIRIIDKNTVISPKKQITKILGNMYLGTENRGALYMLDSSNNPIISVPYSGKFTIKGSDNVLLCPINLNIKKSNEISSANCDRSKLSNSISFDYGKSFKGIYLFKVFPTSLGKVSIKIYDSSNKLLNEYNTKNITVAIDVTKNNPYYNYINKTSGKLISSNKKNGYFIPKDNLKQKEAIQRIENAFNLKNSNKGNKYTDLTRLEFLKLISEKSGIKSNNESNLFLDIDKEAKVYANILLDYGACFLDEFGAKYFQPNKKITRQEAAYILAKIKKL